MVVISNPAFAGSRLFTNKTEGMEYVIEDSYVVINHALKGAKVNKELVENCVLISDLNIVKIL
jgi:hypothetical protein